MTDAWRKARRISGLAKFERTSRKRARRGGRAMLAWKVYGTPERETWLNLVANATALASTAKGY